MSSTRLKYQWILWNKLPRFSCQCFTVLVSFVFFADVGVGIVRASEADSSTAVQMVQQPDDASTEPNRAAAEQICDEGMQLYQIETAESLRQAIPKLEQAAILYRQAGDKRSEALCLHNIGFIYSLLGDKQKALEFYNQALPLSQAVGDKRGEAITLSNIAVVKREQGNLTEALTQIEQAVDIIEFLRTKIVSPELRTSYFATQQDYGYYELYIDLLMQLHQQNPNQGYDAKALHVSERSRARSLIELLTEANADIRQGIEPQLLEQERTLQQKTAPTLNYQESYFPYSMNKVTPKMASYASMMSSTSTYLRNWWY